MGVWIETSVVKKRKNAWFVTPRVGVWIETNTIEERVVSALSLPAWECGLKPGTFSREITGGYVTPRVGVWIETMGEYVCVYLSNVTPRVGVWIETPCTRFYGS